MRLFLAILTFALVVIACNFESNTALSNEPVKYRAPKYFPEMPIPGDNLPTEARLLLGRKLFYEKRLSENGTTSCGSCHITSMAFTDGEKKSMGAHGKTLARNTSTLANLGWSPHLLSEGGVKSLELQALGPTQDSSEMSLPLHLAVKKLSNDKEYQNLSMIAYNRPLDEYVIIRAIACFERSLISADSRFDRWYYLKKSNEFNENEKRGFDLFMSEKLACGSCHTPPFFTDYKFYNIGLFETDQDAGRERVTYAAADRGKFKTPTLRNIELTAPYMHDGSMSSLEEVIEFYNNGGKRNINKDNRIKPLYLTDDEKSDLLAFLKSLTDWNFVQNQTFVPLEQ